MGQWLCVPMVLIGLAMMLWAKASSLRRPKGWSNPSSPAPRGCGLLRFARN